jgi:hypothetical protein
LKAVRTPRNVRATSKAMPSNSRITFVLWASIACLLVINSIAIILIVRQRTENIRLQAENTRQRTEIEASHAQREKLLDYAAQSELPAVRVIPTSHPGAFAGVKESDIPGRYRWFESEKNRGLITLNADRTFTSLNGQKSDTYRWTLSPDQLVMEYNRMTVYYTNVEAPGIYLGVRTDRKSQRLEKVE